MYKFALLGLLESEGYFFIISLVQIRSRQILRYLRPGCVKLKRRKDTDLEAEIMALNSHFIIHRKPTEIVNACIPESPLNLGTYANKRNTIL